MRSAVFLALACLFPATAPAQDDDYYSLRWSLSAGPSVAVPSGNRYNLTGVRGCLTCGRAAQRVFGADEGIYHAGLNIAGNAKYDIAIRGELMYTHSVSEIQRPPKRVCVGFKCTQDRKAMRDDTYFLGFGVEFAPTQSLIHWEPLKKFPVEPYLAATGGLQMNRVRWTWDTTGTSTALEGSARAFGSFASGGLGLRVRAKSVLVYAEARRVQTYSTPGTSMAPISIGLQHWLRLRNYGY